MHSSLVSSAVSVVLLFLLAGASQPAQRDAAPEYDIILRGGKVIDGTGNPWFYADVAISAGRIAAVGNLSAARGKVEHDVTGKVVAPGFIDVHSHVDDDIFRYPLAENFVRDGVTTIVSGNCGGSETDVRTFLRRATTRPAAVNHATLVGHNSVLARVKGRVKGELTPEQLERAKGIVRDAMLGGAIGFSTGLIYTPGQWSTTEEIIELARVSGAMGGIYATHMRSEGTAIMNAIDEALRIGRESGSRVQISHFKLPTTAAERMGRSPATLPAASSLTLARVVEARAGGQEVYLDQYPYTASSTTISTLLPDWVLEGGATKAREILADPAQLPKVFADMRGPRGTRGGRADLSYVVISSFGPDASVPGKNIKQLAQMAKLRERGELLGSPEDVSKVEVSLEEQFRIVVDLYLRGGAGAVFHSMDETEVTNILRHPLVAVARDAGTRAFGSGAPHPRLYGTASRVLGRYARELGVISMEDAVRKLTSMPAQAFRLHDRGQVRVGFRADLTVFDPATVSDKATFEDSHQYSVGIARVFTNGVLVFDGEKMTGAKPGLPVFGPGWDGK